MQLNARCWLGRRRGKARWLEKGRGRRRRRLLSSGAFALAALLAATPAQADRGALSLDLGVGAAGLNLPAPYASGAGSTVGVGFEGMVGLRYALTNEVEFTVAGYFQPSVAYVHEGVGLQLPGSTEPITGTVSNSLYFWGAVGGVRYVGGSVWKLVLGLEAGWCHRVYTEIQFNGQVSFPLESFNTSNFLLQPLLGVEWAFADHWSASLLARLMVLMGPDPTLGASVLVSISYAWFL